MVDTVFLLNVTYKCKNISLTLAFQLDFLFYLFFVYSLISIFIILPVSMCSTFELIFLIKNTFITKACKYILLKENNIFFHSLINENNSV